MTLQFSYQVLRLTLEKWFSQDCLSVRRLGRRPDSAGKAFVVWWPLVIQVLKKLVSFLFFVAFPWDDWKEAQTTCALGPAVAIFGRYCPAPSPHLPDCTVWQLPVLEFSDEPLVDPCLGPDDKKIQQQTIRRYDTKEGRNRKRWKCTYSSLLPVSYHYLTGQDFCMYNAQISILFYLFPSLTSQNVTNLNTAVLEGTKQFPL